jgi:cysteine dioxygenase
MPGITNQHNSFETLIQALSDKLGPSSGINSDDVDEHELQQLMKDYTSDESEWSKYSFSSTNMPYTRNLVDKGNGKSNLVLVLENLTQGYANDAAHSRMVTRPWESYP